MIKDDLHAVRQQHQRLENIKRFSIGKRVLAIFLPQTRKVIVNKKKIGSVFIRNAIKIVNL